MFIISFTNLFGLFDVILNICMTAEIAQLGERQTEDLKVPGSNTENSLRHEFWIIPGLVNFTVFLLLSRTVLPQWATFFQNSALIKLHVYSVNFTVFLLLSRTVLPQWVKKFPLIVCVHYFFYESLQFIWRYFKYLLDCRDSSVGRASDWRSEGPWFKYGELAPAWVLNNPGSRQLFSTILLL